MISIRPTNSVYFARRLLLALGSAALHVLLERLALGDVGLLGLGVVGVEGGRLRVAGVRLGVWNENTRSDQRLVLQDALLALRFCEGTKVHVR
jgi:hypothetical protein